MKTIMCTNASSGVKTIKSKRFNLIHFGVSSSPYIAIRIIQQLADDERNKYPKASVVLKRHLYVNNLLTGSNTIEEAHTLRKEVTAILSRDEFNIHQWTSNKKQIIDDLYLDAI